jgi:hypothetical protein
MRAYCDGTLSSEAADRVEEAIDLAEARSATTCDVCEENVRLQRPLRTGR